MRIYEVEETRTVGGIVVPRREIRDVIKFLTNQGRLLAPPLTGSHRVPRDLEVMRQLRILGAARAGLSNWYEQHRGRLPALMVGEDVGIVAAKVEDVTAVASPETIGDGFILGRETITAIGLEALRDANPGEPVIYLENGSHRIE